MKTSYEIVHNCFKIVVNYLLVVRVFYSIVDSLIWTGMITSNGELECNVQKPDLLPIGTMYSIYGNIYHQYTPNVSIFIYIYISYMDPMGYENPCLNQRVSGYDSSGFRLCSCCSRNFSPTCSGCEMQGIRVKQPIHWHALHYIQYSPSQYIFCSTCRQYCWFQVF